MNLLKYIIARTDELTPQDADPDSEYHRLCDSEFTPLGLLSIILGIPQALITQKEYPFIPAIIFIGDASLRVVREIIAERQGRHKAYGGLIGLIREGFNYLTSTPTPINKNYNNI